MSPLKIMVAGQQLTLYPDSKIKFNLKNDLFILDSQPASRTYEFTIPVWGNQRIFLHANSLEVREKASAYTCSIYLYEQFWTNGILSISSYTRDEYTISIEFDRGFYQEFAAKNLRSFQYKRPDIFRNYINDFFGAEFHFTYQGVGSPVGSTTLTFHYGYATEEPYERAHTRTFLYDSSSQTMADMVSEIIGYFNSIKDTTGFEFRAVDGQALHFTIHNLVNWKESIFFFNVETDNSDYLLPPFDAGYIFPDPWHLHKMVHQAMIAIGEEELSVLPIYAPEWLDFSDPSFRGYINEYIPGYGPVENAGTSSSDFTFRSPPLSPMAKLKYVLYQIHKETGIGIDTDLFFDEILSKLVLFNSDSTLHLNSYKQKYTYGPFGTYYGVFDYQQIVPNITVADLLNAIRFGFNTLIVYDSRGQSMRLVPVKEILSSTREKDWSDKANYEYSGSFQRLKIYLKYTFNDEPLTSRLLVLDTTIIGNPVQEVEDLPETVAEGGKSIIKVLSDNTYYSFNFSTSTWSEYALDLYDTDALATDLTNITDVIAPFAPMFIEKRSYTDPQAAHSAVDITVPITHSQGNVSLSDKRASQFRLLFDRGMKPSSDSGRTYPKGDYRSFDPGDEGTKYSLAWNDTNGLKEVWWEKWLAFLANTEIISTKISLSAADIISLDMLLKYRIDNQQYFIDELEFEVSDQIETVYATLYKINT